VKAAAVGNAEAALLLAQRTRSGELFVQRLCYTAVSPISAQTFEDSQPRAIQQLRMSCSGRSMAASSQIHFENCRERLPVSRGIR
jgi:hypothetical protein